MEVNATCLAMFVNRSMCAGYINEDDVIEILDGSNIGWRSCVEPAEPTPLQSPINTIQPTPIQTPIPTPVPTPHTCSEHDVGNVDVMIVYESDGDGNVGFGVYLVNNEDDDDMIGTYTPTTYFYDMCTSGKMVCNGRYNMLYDMLSDGSELCATVTLNGYELRMDINSDEYQMQLVWYASCYVEINYDMDTSAEMQWNCVMKMDGECDKYNGRYRVCGMSMELVESSQKDLISIPHTRTDGYQYTPVRIEDITASEHTNIPIVWSWPLLNDVESIYIDVDDGMSVSDAMTALHDAHWDGVSKRYTGVVTRVLNEDELYDYVISFDADGVCTFVVIIHKTYVSIGDATLIVDRILHSASIYFGYKTDEPEPEPEPMHETIEINGNVRIELHTCVNDDGNGNTVPDVGYATVKVSPSDGVSYTYWITSELDELKLLASLAHATQYEVDLVIVSDSCCASIIYIAVTDTAGNAFSYPFNADATKSDSPFMYDATCIHRGTYTCDNTLSTGDCGLVSLEYIC